MLRTRTMTLPGTAVGMGTVERERGVEVDLSIRARCLSGILNVCWVRLEFD